MGCLWADGGHRLPGWSGREARAWKAPGTRPNRGDRRGGGGGGGQSSPPDAPDSLGAEGLNEGAGASRGSRGSRGRSEARPHPASRATAHAGSRSSGTAAAGLRQRHLPNRQREEHACVSLDLEPSWASARTHGSSHRHDRSGGNPAALSVPTHKMKGCQIRINNLIFWYRYFKSRTIYLLVFKLVMNLCASL